MKTKAKVCVVGGGAAGMAVVRSLMARGVPFDAFERHTDVGGLWDQKNPGSPVYDSAHFISSKGQSHFHDFPMPDDYPDYPSHAQVLAYMRSFADAYGLRNQIRFGVGVERTERVDAGWRVTTSDGSTSEYSVARLRHWNELACFDARHSGHVHGRAATLAVLPVHA